MADKDKIIIPTKLRRDHSHEEEDKDQLGSGGDSNSETVIHIESKNKKDDDTISEEKESLIETKGNIIQNTGTWNYKIMLLLQKIGKKTMGYRWMHDQESKIISALEKKYMIADVILKVITGLLTGSTIGTLVTGSDNTTVLYIFTAISLAFQLATGVITAIRETNDYSSIASQHIAAASKFGEINMEIQNQFALDIDDRESDKEFLSTTIKKFNDLNGSIPPISESIKKKFIASDEDNEIYNPIIVGDYNNIQIIDKKNNNKEDDDIEKGSKSKYEIDRWLSRF
ncbi:hypothetical protein Klosneuvirus_4_55 [Klosneuvirus KNV1]|uniref:SMODS and SLOG-associating 2TM effector domain-containing protein n=1 Tax=Klosneuvirus KNV1 TaxID=1977640 RepID=A0A1V0SKJ0_9VIRU|nr:hypothetical protein Klosneuvirus_4_55 [Klosneuvirus KNV1]